MIETVLDIDEVAQRTQNGAFRDTLYKYWNGFPEEFCAFLLNRIEVLKYGRFLAQILGHLSVDLYPGKRTCR